MAIPFIPIIILSIASLLGWLAIKVGIIDIGPVKAIASNATQVVSDVGTSQVASSGKGFAVAIQEAIDIFVTKFGIDPHFFWFALLLIVIGGIVFAVRTEAMGKLLAMAAVLIGIALLLL